jgi:hypothetical protein
MAISGASSISSLRRWFGIARPADDLAAPRIEHRGQTQEAGRGWNERDVGHPKLVRSLSLEVAIHKVRRGPRILVATRGHDTPAAHTGNPGRTHQPSLALPTEPFASRCQIARAVGSHSRDNSSVRLDRTKSSS